ncbi:BZ3500_MvSof-1268-A1-R1_Chr1-3g01811 [Microbotryum saponariae]|uniref:BZ3500_MvSof-1268-A1-R1_Chr1-3g01811 protein n=1 Tax=Microbotryum saponariae TaxID=289078 RepID=A0A2X0KLX7_9BASI|nr:BZ3500_MvSof-1268-A1-R1_Chr1-3g01811 [Microbotryum saponariae]SCZ94639.1 BZ3501_MvSof-1269-A2-R1_Chr1-3g01413 [Microbotryum saponariae]
MAKKVLLYSLPHDCPIPWPAHPTYAIVDPSERRSELDQAYLEALYSDVHNNIISKSRQFGHHLLALASERPRAEVEHKIRSILLPLHDFDRKWRNTIPALVKPTSTENVAPVTAQSRPLPPTGKKHKLADKEVTLLLDTYRKWRVAEEAKIEKDRPKSLPVIQEDVEHPQAVTHIDDDAPGQGGKLGSMHPEGVEEELVHKPVAWTKKEVNDAQWITAGELFDLLLLTLITLPAPLESPEVKAKKKKDPERHASTLDPELLLDFLTDRLQIWRVMRDVNALGLGADSQVSNAKKKEGVEIEDRDEVQQWWLDVVEALFGPHASPALLSHHRAKLFPSATPADALALRLVPAPSPFKTRSLLSLDKSARRKQRDQRPLVAESPTMKRLLGLDSSTLGGSQHDSFKVPTLPFSKSKSGGTNAAAPSSKHDSSKTDHNGRDKTSESTAPRSKPPRKQPRPLPRGDSLISSSKGLFNRREVSFGKPKTGAGIKKKAISASKVAEQTVAEQAGAHRVNKRKSWSIIYAAADSMLTTESSSTANMASFTLVPDTPAASRTSSATISTQAPVVPSFAALGAAFRPGASSTPDFLPAGLSAAAPMDWDDDEEDELYLRGFERDNGKLSRGKRQVDLIMGTPEQPSRTSWVVPDT